MSKSIFDRYQAEIKAYHDNDLTSGEIYDKLLKRYGIELTSPISKKPTTKRSLERWIKKNGFSRKIDDPINIKKRTQALKQKHKENAKKTSFEKSNGLSSTLRFAILKRDKFRCVLCGCTSATCVLEVDHIKPSHFFKKGDRTRNAPQNLRTLCRRCNMGRLGNDYPDNWGNFKKI